MNTFIRVYCGSDIIDDFDDEFTGIVVRGCFPAKKDYTWDERGTVVWGHLFDCVVAMNDTKL